MIPTLPVEMIGRNFWQVPGFREMKIILFPGKKTNHTLLTASNCSSSLNNNNLIFDDSIQSIADSSYRRF